MGANDGNLDADLMQMLFEDGNINESEKNYWTGKDMDDFNAYLADVHRGVRKRMGE